MKPEEIREKLLLLTKAAYRETMAHYDAIQDLSRQVGEVLQENVGVLDEATLADLGYLFRKMEEFNLGTKRECYHKQDQIGRVLALLVLKRATASGGEAKAVGEIATATPDVKVGARLPPKGSEDWHTLLSSFGVNEEARKKKLVTLYWPGIRDWVTSLEAKGYPVPDELKTKIRQYPDCTYRPRKRNLVI